jgi:hypothetical protein
VDKNGGQTPFIRGEVTWNAGTAWYNVSPLYGYNRSLKIAAENSACPAMQWWEDRSYIDLSRC